MIHDLRKEQMLLIEPAAFEIKCRALDEFDLNAWLAAQEPQLITPQARDYDTDIYGDPLPKVEIVGNVAIIPIVGVIIHGYPSIYKRFGYCDAADILFWLTAANANPAVEKIILNVNSPGGTVAGIREIAEAVRDSEKKVGVYCGAGCVGSAAYWATCAAHGVFGTSSSTWGSVGVYATFENSAKSFEMLGYTVRLFRSGKLKGMGEPGTDLTREQEEYIQARVDELGAAFRGFVKQARPVKDEDLQGQCFDGNAAAGRGFIDAVVSDMSEAIRLLR